MTPEQMRRRFFVALGVATVLMLLVGAVLFREEVARIEAKKAELREEAKRGE